MNVKWISTTEKRGWVRRTVAPARGAQAELTVTGTGRQVWRGFGACFNEISWIALQGMSAATRKAVLDSLFGAKEGCDFTFCRVPIGASDYATEWYSHNETDGDYAMKRFSIERDCRCLLPFIWEALQRRPDLRLFASPWSPPTWMKFPKAYNHGRLIRDRKTLEAYALYFSKFVTAYAQEGVRVDHVYVQNEPVADQKFPSCVWTGAELRDFIRDFLGPRFRKDGIDAEIWLGTLNTDDYNGFVHAVLSDAKARAYVKGVGFQWAGRGAIQRTRAAWPDMPVLQTENECGDGQNTWDYAQYVFGLMQHYIGNGAVGYVYWNMVLPPGGRSTWGWPQNALITLDPESGTVTHNPEFWVMRHAAQYVRPGAVVLDLAGTWTPYTLGFINPDGSRVLVVNNPFDRVEPFTVSWPGMAAFKAELPARSFNTFVIAGAE